MAQQQLSSTIVLNGRVDPSANSISRYLGQMSNKLLAMGAVMNRLSQPLITLGKQSTQLYAEFEDHMKYIQGLGELTASQLNEVEAAARQAGATTRYTASQAAQALEDNAVAGMHYKDSITLLQDELTLAAAGNLELEKSASHLLNALRITGTPAEDAGTLVDQIVKAAASSKSDVDGLGEAIQRLGTTMQYLSGGSTEMLTLLGSLGNLGAEDAEMGTWARNVLLSLIAPLNKADELMQELSYSTEEIEEALDGVSVGDSKKLIERLGLEVYDEDTGKLRGVFDILADLNTALASMTDEERNRAMATIFNKRTLGYAEGLMRIAASGEWRELFKTIADSDGYAEQVASRRESGLGGALRLLKSQWEEVQLTIGETLSPQIQQAAKGIGDMFDSFLSLDDATKTRVIGLMEGIAAAGPAMLGVGAAMKFLQFAASPTGVIALATAGMIGLGIAMDQVADRDFTENFGDAQLDLDMLAAELDQTSAAMRRAYATTNEFAEASDDAMESYAALYTELKGKLISQALAGGELSEEDKKQLADLGKEMMGQLLDGMGNATAADMELFTMFNKKGTLDDGSYSAIIGLLQSQFEKDKEALSGLGAELYEALMGDWSEEETAQRVQAVLDKIDAVVEANKQRTKDEQARAMIERGRFVDYEDAESYIQLLGENFQSDLDYNDEQIAARLAGLYVAAQNENTPEAWDAYNAAVEASKATRVQMMQGSYANMIRGLDALFSANGMGMEFRALLGVANGTVSPDIRSVMTDEEVNNYKHIMEMLQPIAKIMEGAGEIDKMNLDDLAPKDRNFLEWAGRMAFGIDTPTRQAVNSEGAANVLGAGRKPESLLNIDKYLLGKSDGLEMVIKPLTQGLDETVDGLGQTQVDLPLGANPAEAQQKIGALSEEEVVLETDADTRKARRAIEELSNIEVTVKVKTQMSEPQPQTSVPGYALGGRADSPSIFGEAGPEWAIPERHDGRTAALLKAAAQASGFKDPTGGAAKIIFSPRISVTGGGANIEAALDRAQRAFFERLKRDGLVSAATAY